MRIALSILTALALLAGCRTLEKSVVAPAPVPQPAAPESASVAPVQLTPAPVMPVAFEEPLAPPAPAPEPETLPSSSLKPVLMGRLSLADLENMALTANPSVARAGALVEAARGNWLQVGLPFNPTAGYEGQQLGSGGRAEQQGVFVSQEIVRGGKLKLNREVAAQEIAKAEHELAAQQQRVLTDVRMAFYQVLIAQQQERLSEELRNIAGLSVKTADALLQGKEVGRVDLVQSQLELANADILVQNARNRSRAAWQSLSAVAGNPHMLPTPLDGELDDHRPPRDWQTSLQRLVSASPEIAVAMAEIERARWVAERARVEKTPNVTVQGLYIFRDNGIGGGQDGNLVVGVPLPVWNKNQGAVIQAAQEAAAAERALQQLELSLQNRLAPVFERYANALNQVEKYRNTILPAAQESLNLVRQSYQAGETGYVNLLTVQRTNSQTNLNYLDSLRELRAADAQIEGLLLSGSLDSR